MSDIDLSANLKYVELSVNDFREMVNYESGKNKGFVRITRKADGSLGVEKINNKVDIFVNSRTNVNASNNRALRQIFADALANNMVGATKEQKDNVRNIALALGSDNVSVSTTPLSRREIRAAFAAYDRVMNEALSRRTTADQMIINSMKAANINMDQQAFMKKYMHIKNGTFDSDNNYANCFKMYDTNSDQYRIWEQQQKNKTNLGTDTKNYDTQGAYRSAPMVMDDIQFAFKMQDLQKAIDAGVKQYKLEQELLATTTSLRDKLLAPDDVFAGDGLSDKFKTDLANAIATKLRTEGIDVDAGTGEIGSKRTCLNIFMKQVAPALIREARYQYKMTTPPNGESKDAGNQRIDSLLDFDQMCNHAKTFFNEAKEVLKMSEDKLAQMLEEMAVDNLGNAIRIRAAKDIMTHASVRKNEAIQMGNTIANEAKSLTVEAKIQAAAEKYIQKTCSNVPIAGGLAAENTSKLVEKRVEEVILALQINNGERYAIGGGKYQDDPSFLSCLKHGSDIIKEYANHYNGGMDMYTKLMERVFTRYVNARIDHVRSWGKDTRLNLTVNESTLAEYEKGIKNAVAAYVSFEDKVHVEMNRAYKAFQKIINKQVKNEKIKGTAGDYLLNKVLVNALKGNAETSINLLLDRVSGNMDEKEIDAAVEQAVKRTIQRGLSAVYHELSEVSNSDKAEMNFLEKTEKFRKVVDERCEKVSKLFYNSVLEAHTEMAKNEDTFLGKQVAGLDKKQVKDFVKAVTDEVVSRLDGEIKERLNTYRDDPEIYKNENNVFALLDPILQGKDSGSVTLTLGQVLEDRGAAFQRWMGTKVEDRQNTMNDICANVVTTLQESAPNLPRQVIARLAQAPKNALFDKVESHATYYVQVDGLNATKDKIAEELKTTILPTLKKFAQPCEEFLKEVDKLVAQHEGVTKEQRDEVVLYTLTLAAGSKDPASIKTKHLRQLFYKAMSDKLMNNVNNIKASYDEFVDKMNKAESGFIEAKKYYEKTFTDESKSLPDSVKKHIHDVVLPKYINKLNTIFCTTPESLFSENLDKFFAVAEEELVKLIGRAKRCNVADKTNFNDLLFYAGLGLYIPEEGNKKFAYANEYKEMCDNLTKLSENSNERQFIEERICKLLDGNEKEAQVAHEEIHTKVCDYAAPVAGRLKSSVFNKMELEPAMELFNQWLDSFATTAGIEGFLDIKLDGNDNTLGSMARGMFIARYKDIMQDLIEGKDENIKYKRKPLLSFDLIEQITNYFGTIGVKEAKKRLLESLVSESYSKFSEMISLINTAPSGTYAASEVVRFNDEFKEIIQTVVDGVNGQTELNSKFGLEKYARNKDNIIKLFHEQIDHKINELIGSFSFHYGLATQIQKTVDSVIAKFDDTINDWVSKINAFNNDSKTKNTNKIDINSFYSHFDDLKESFKGVIDGRAKELLESKVTVPDSEDIDKKLNGTLKEFFAVLKNSKKGDLVTVFKEFCKKTSKAINWKKILG